MKTGRLTFGLALLLTGACVQNTGPVLDADPTGSIVVDFNSNIGTLKRDWYDIESVRLTGDTLHLRITHGGGCARHEYGLIAYNGWMESHPVQVGATVLHDANGDNCRALIQADLRYDLQPLRAAYGIAYRTDHGTVIIQLSDPSPGSGLAPASVAYTF